MPTLYHVTPRSNLKRIREVGLLPSKSTGAVIDEPAIFLGATQREAISWASFNTTTGKYGFSKPMVVLAVKSPDYFEEDPEAFGRGGSYFTTSSIPPKDIRVVKYLAKGSYHLARTRGSEEKIRSLRKYYEDEV